MRLPSNAVAVALSRRSQAAGPVSIAHVGSDQGIGRPRCPGGDRGAAGVADTPYYGALGAPRSRRSGPPPRTYGGDHQAKDARQRFEALLLRKHPVVGVGSSTRTLLTPG